MYDVAKLGLFLQPFSALVKPSSQPNHLFSNAILKFVCFLSLPAKEEKGGC
jgi:hypothetical protein